LGLELGAALDVVLERRVAAVDEDVALVEERGELVDRRLCRLPVRMIQIARGAESALTTSVSCLTGSAPSAPSSSALA
jgi:hypothetical protein